MILTTHARARLAERYGLAITDAEARTLFLDITGGRTLLLSRQAGGKEERMAEVRGQRVHLVYDPEQATVVTVKPRHAAPNCHHGEKPATFRRKRNGSRGARLLAREGMQGRREADGWGEMA